MFHVTNFGAFAGSLKDSQTSTATYPRRADNHVDMSWDGMMEWDDESWSDFVDEALAATKKAEEALAEWREENA